MPIILDGIKPSVDVRRELREDGRPVLLGYSCGKDSTAAWIALLEAGIEVVPVYLYLIPGLKFVEDYLAYAEDWFGADILRYPHPSLFRMLRARLFQPPERVAAIDACDLPLYGMDEAWAMVIEDLGLPKDTWRADGMRANDSLERRSMIQQYGPIRENSRKCSPIWDWTADETRDWLDSFGIEGPPDYAMFGTSFDGLAPRFTEPIRESFPEDYETIKAWFPLIGLDTVRREAYGLRF